MGRSVYLAAPSATAHNTLCAPCRNNRDQATARRTRSPQKNLYLQKVVWAAVCGCQFS